MNKTIVCLGIIILFIGLGSTLNSNITQNNPHQDIVNQVENQWTITGNYNEGETLYLNFIPHHDWSLFPYPDIGEPSYSKHFIINIMNKADDNYTSFKVILAAPHDEIPPQPPYNFMLTIYDIEVTHHGGIITDDKPSGAQGKIRNDGEYIVESKLIPPSVIDKYLENGTIWPHDASPPPQLILYRISTEVTYPYSFLFPAGIVTAATGCIISFWGIRKSSRSRRHTRKHT